jgi:hypothetical protein
MSICCKNSRPVFFTMFTNVPYRKQYLLTVSLYVGLPGTILIRTHLE